MSTAGPATPGSIRTTWLIPAWASGRRRRSRRIEGQAMSWIDQRPDDAMDGAFTVVGPESVRTVEAAPFREAMSRLGAAVHVITTAGPAGKTGATATAACSVTDAPPTLLMCLNRGSQTYPVVMVNGVFCVNTLGASEAEIANLFAGRTG